MLENKLAMFVLLQTHLFRIMTARQIFSTNFRRLYQSQISKIWSGVRLIIKVSVNRLSIIFLSKLLTLKLTDREKLLTLKTYI